MINPSEIFNSTITASEGGYETRWTVPQHLPYFEGHFPVAEIPLHQRLSDEVTFSFEGIGFVVQGSARSENAKDQVIVVEMHIDEQIVETIELPTDFTRRRFTPFWKYGLAQGKHTIRLKIRNPSADAAVSIERAVIYGSTPLHPAV